MTKPPSISAILTTFNGLSRGYLKQAIDSVLAQTLKPNEFFLIDDGSTDGTAEFVEKTYPMVKILKKVNGGLSSARNHGVTRSTCDFVCFLDDDDEWHPSKLEQQAQFLLSRPEHALVYSAMDQIDEGSRLLGTIHPRTYALGYPQLLIENPVLGPSGVMIRRTVLDQVGPFDESLKMVEDFDYWIRTARVGMLGFIDQPLLRYRIHKTQMTAKRQKIERTVRTVIERDLSTHKNPDAEKYFDYYIYSRFFRAFYSFEWTYALELIQYIKTRHRFYGGVFILRSIGAALRPFPRPYKLWIKLESRFIDLGVPGDARR